MQSTTPQVIEIATKSLTRTRPHEVPSTVPVKILRDIPASVRAGRSFRQVAKDANVTQHVVAQLNDQRIERRVDGLCDEVAALRDEIRDMRRAA